MFAYRTAYELTQLGCMVVSGMAFGIDGCAHRGCLDAGGTTIAVLGTPIDKLYPASNRGLAQRILEKGAILSEYEPGHDTRSWEFLERNRIVAGLGDALLVVEAGERSGTYTTASQALDQGKTVYVLPGDLTRPMSVGCNKLIAEGANIFLSYEDIAYEIIPNYAQLKKEKDKLLGLSDNEKNILKQIQEG